MQKSVLTNPQDIHMPINLQLYPIPTNDSYAASSLWSHGKATSPDQSTTQLEEINFFLLLTSPTQTPTTTPHDSHTHPTFGQPCVPSISPHL